MENTKKKIDLSINKKIGLATKNLRDPDVLADLIKVAQKLGYDFIDCAWRYGNEAAIGIAIKNIENKVRTKEFNLNISLQSKIWPSQYKGGINKSLKTSLQKLGNLQEIDSYLLHRPHHDAKMTISAWKQLVDCKRIRNVKVIGVSNFDKDLILKLLETSNYLPEFNRIELSVNNMRWDRINFCKNKKISIQAYAPFGLLKQNLNDKRIIKIADKYNATVSQILLAFLLYFEIEPIVSLQSQYVITEDNKKQVSKLIEKEIKEYIKAKDIFLDKKDINELLALNTYTNLHPEAEEIDLDEINREVKNVFTKIKNKENARKIK